MRKIKIAIDGYSACGKSTLARELADKLNYIFIDSGAMYRGVTLHFLRKKLLQHDNLNLEEINQELPQIHLTFQRIEDDICLYLNGENVSEEIRGRAVANLVSRVAAIQSVREKLVSEQRKMGENGGIIMDGRDIGSVVFPDAELKLFVTANQDVRVKRRYNELISKGVSISEDEIRANLIERDYLDTHREISPLIKVQDAIVLDNSNLSKKEQLDLVINLIENLNLPD